ICTVVSSRSLNSQIDRSDHQTCSTVSSRSLNLQKTCSVVSSRSLNLDLNII
ncbi:Os01g0307624, partial [Oryza sativa Japonica Group]